MRAPFNLELQMMRRDAAFAFFVANLHVNRPVHAQNDLIGRQTCRRIDGAAELSIDNVADTFENAAHQTLRQDRVASSLRRLILFVSHESKYVFRWSQVHRAFANEMSALWLF